MKLLTLQLSPFCYPLVLSFAMAQQPLVGQGLLIIEASRSHSDTPPDEWSTRRRDLFLTTHNTHKRQTSMPPVGFEPTISASERPETHALARASTAIGSSCHVQIFSSALFHRQSKERTNEIFFKLKRHESLSLPVQNNKFPMPSSSIMVFWSLPKFFLLRWCTLNDVTAKWYWRGYDEISYCLDWGGGLFWGC